MGKRTRDDRKAAPVQCLDATETALHGNLVVQTEVPVLDLERDLDIDLKDNVLPIGQTSSAHTRANTPGFSK